MDGGLLLVIAAEKHLGGMGAAAFVALNPLVLVHVVGGPHNDGIATLAAMLGVAAVLSKREFSERVKSRLFVVSTLLAAPALVMLWLMRAPVRALEGGS